MKHANVSYEEETVKTFDLQIMITGSEGTDQLFQLKVNLATGEAHADTLPQDGVFHFDDEMTENRMTDEERTALLTQYNMDRTTMPSKLEWVLFSQVLLHQTK